MSTHTRSLVWLLLALILAPVAARAGPTAAPAGPPADLPRVRLRLRVSTPPVAPLPVASAGGSLAVYPRLAVAEVGFELVWTLRGPPRARTRLPPSLETPWERDLRRLEEPDLRPELDPIAPE